ncbi:hypothetical protein [Pseudobutyrivibrio sp. MD2005]|uniref:hypothetical protein n=1 Tax=Pseudobutyrivibrio sp. MD2005 TaxID=1410616 RepID=UPI000489E6B7|nr:hypothetical protein [Pseudobutyrivibrio sp. MD2005]
MKFDYIYKLKYADGITYEQNASKECMSKEISLAEYRKIVEGVLVGIPISNIKGIEELLDDMRSDVVFSDRLKNKDGSSRNKALKKPRDITEIEFYMLERDINRLKKMDNPFEFLEHSTEEMKIYRPDGSYVTIKAESGKVHVSDSRKNTNSYITNAEDFLERISL